MNLTVYGLRQNSKTRKAVIKMATYIEQIINWMQTSLPGSLLYGDTVLIAIVVVPWCIVEIVNRTGHGQLTHSLTWILLGMIFTMIFFSLSLCSYLVGGLLLAMLIMSFVWKMWF